MFGYTVACYKQLRFTFEHLSRADISDKNLYEITNRPAGVATEVFYSLKKPSKIATLLRVFHAIRLVLDKGFLSCRRKTQF